VHAVIRIVSFLVLAVSLSLGAEWRHVVLGGALVLLGYVFVSAEGVRRLGTMLLRLRWLWLSLFVVYFWFTPGIPVLPGLERWSPTYDGLREGLVRIGILAVIASGANLLLQVTAQESLLAAIHWLATPLEFLGLSRDRFALRLVLVLETVPRIQPLARTKSKGGLSGKGKIVRIANLASDLFRNAMEQAQTAPPREIRVPDDGRPPLREWLFPIALSVAFWIVG
jgi:hypothetical protein